MKTRTKILIAAVIAVAAYVTTARDNPLEKEAKHMNRGNEYFANGEFQKARVEYRNAAKLAPIDPEISYRWGLVDEAEGDIRNAYANFMRAEQQNPHYAEALLKIAHYQLVVEQYTEVQKRIDIVLTDTPDNAEAHALKAALHLRRKENDATRKEVEMALAKEPANITAIAVLTGLYVAEGNMEKAEATVDEGIAKNPKDMSLLLLKVKMFERPLNIEKINQTYQDIIKLQPGDVQLRSVLADIYMQAGKKDEAEATLRLAVRDLPGDWNMKHRLIDFLSRYKSMEEAEKEIQSTLQAFPDHSEVNFWMAELYMNNNQIDKAVALLEQIAAKDTSDRQSLLARSSLARISFRKGEKELAQKLIAAVLAKAPANAGALSVRASIATDEGRYQSAVSDLRLIIRDNPKNKDALQQLAEVLLLQGYPDLAIETLSQLVELSPNDAQAQVRLAQMYNENKDPQHAMKILNAVTQSNPDYTVGWESMARIAIAMKDMAKAKEAISRLQTFKGQEQVAQFLNGQMAQANGSTADAEATYKEIIKTDPTSALAEHAVFEMVEKHHTPEELSASIEFLASLNTDSPYINTIIGEGYMTLGKTELAIPPFDKAIQGHSTLQDAYLNRAKIYHDTGNTEKALELLNEARTVNTSDIRADLTIGDIYIEQQKYTDAIAVYDNILQRFPELDMPANNYAALIADFAYTDTAMLEKAAKVAERFTSGKNIGFLDTLSWVYYRQGKTAQAQSTMARVMITESEVRPEMHYHYGAILLQAGNKVKAKEELEKASGKDVSSPVAQKAAKLLKEI